MIHWLSTKRELCDLVAAGLPSHRELRGSLLLRFLAQFWLHREEALDTVVRVEVWTLLQIQRVEIVKVVPRLGLPEQGVSIKRVDHPLIASHQYTLEVFVFLRELWEAADGCVHLEFVFPRLVSGL